LNVLSEPAGAAVTIDGQKRGFTPLLVDDLAVGPHTVILDHTSGSVRQVVRVKADEPATLDALIYSGWLKVFAPFELQASDGGRIVNFDKENRIMLSPGRHDLQFTNRSLGYVGSQSVVVRPGEVTTASVVPPKTVVTLTTIPPAEVWIDGTRVGETPLVDLEVAIGTREFLFKHATLGERRVTTTVTTKPLRIDVDFTKLNKGT
jgi:hypothetical protein